MLRTVDDCLFDENETLSCFGRDIKGFAESHFLIFTLENIVILATAIDRTTKKTITEDAKHRHLLLERRLPPKFNLSGILSFSSLQAPISFFLGDR